MRAKDKFINHFETWKLVHPYANVGLIDKYIAQLHFFNQTKK